jgi:hypothetical protein
MAERIDFSWNAGPNTDYYQLFEDDVMVVDNILQPQFSLMMTNIVQGTHNYQVRGVNQFGEGQLSDPVTINFILPVRVTGLRYSVA